MQQTVDMISKLPDHILHLILSRLPTTEEASRTSILSRRWRNLWTSAPSIDIDCSRGWKKFFKKFKKDKFEEFVFRSVLANKSVDLDSFRLCCAHFYNMSTVGRWIDAAVRRNVKQLYLSFCVNNDEIEVPNCLVNSGSLEVLSLCLFARRLNLPRNLNDVVVCPALRVLELNDVDLRGNDLVKDFFKSCPLLEDLSLVRCVMYRCDHLCILCQKLKNLRFDNLSGFLCIPRPRLQICCPKLAFLELSSFMAKEFIFQSLDSLKKAAVHPLHDIYVWAGNVVCELFVGFSHVESLSLDISAIYERINLEDFPESLPNLKTLELTTAMGCFNMDVAIRILVCSPNLESLHLIIQTGLWYTSFPTEDRDRIFAEIYSSSESLSTRIIGVFFFSLCPSVFLVSLPNLKTLKLTTATYIPVSELIRFLTGLPHLESLHLIIKESYFYWEDLKWDEAETRSILTCHLKRVEFLNFYKEKLILDVARCFLEHGNALDEMVFRWNCDEAEFHERSMEIMKEVSKFHKASSTVKLITLNEIS